MPSKNLPKFLLIILGIIGGSWVIGYALAWLIWGKAGLF